jgi:hypothetical protein
MVLLSMFVVAVGVALVAVGTARLGLTFTLSLAGGVPRRRQAAPLASPANPLSEVASFLTGRRGQSS